MGVTGTHWIIVWAEEGTAYSAREIAPDGLNNHTLGITRAPLSSYQLLATTNCPLRHHCLSKTECGLIQTELDTVQI